jgi:hypothetical protein
MKMPLLLLLAALGASAQAQMTVPTPKEPPVKRPADPGMDSPANSGSVVVPPSTGNEEIARKPKNVDPKIDDATGDIDRRNRKLSRDKGMDKGMGKDQSR